MIGINEFLNELFLNFLKLIWFIARGSSLGVGLLIFVFATTSFYMDAAEDNIQWKHSIGEFTAAGILILIAFL